MTSLSPVLWGLLSRAVAAVPSPTPSAGPSPAAVVPAPDPDLVTPGTIGFLVTFGVAVALVVLVRDMVRRNRGLVVRAGRRDAERRDDERRNAERRDADPRAGQLPAGQDAGGTSGPQPPDGRGGRAGPPPGTVPPTA